jgi:hypothetical protein
MRLFSLLLLISTCINATQAVTVSKRVEIPICTNADLELALTPTVAYNTALQWSKQANLHKWQFNSKVVNATAIPCVQYSYDTHIKLPSVFASYIGALMREIHIDKDVCFVDSVYVEKVRVRDVAIISGLEITSHSTIDMNDILRSDVTISYQIPWYVKFMSGIASHHLMKSFEDKFHVLAMNICAG